MDQLLFAIQQEFPVIDEQGCTELNPQVTGTFLDNSDVAPAGERLLETSKGPGRRVAENQGCDAMALIRRLT